MKFDRLFLDDVRAQVRISEVIAPRVSWARKSNPSRGDFWACCPIHGSTSPTFHCDDNKGFFKCFSCGEAGDHFRFITACEGKTFMQAVEEVASMAGIRINGIEGETPEQIRAREERAARVEAKRRRDQQAEERERQKLVESAGALWKASLPFAGTLAQDYLRSRGIDIDDPNLRFHPSLNCRINGDLIGQFPALLARVQGADGRGTSIWRIYLNKTGGALIGPDGKKVKLGVGPARGGAVRLGGEDAEEIGIGEGIESSASARVMDSRLPVWAGLSTSGIIGFDPPPHVRFVRIFPDGDLAKRRDGKDNTPSGMYAAWKLHNRLESEGRVRSEIVEPPHNADWNDVLQSLRRAKL